MFRDYFNDWEVRSKFRMEFVSLWPGWLGPDNYFKLDEVTECEWSRFNSWIRCLSKDYSIEIPNFNSKTLSPVSDIESILSNYQESMNKEYSEFLKLVLPELGCVISEEWDFTFIVWYTNEDVVRTLSPYIENCKLKHFHDTRT